MHDTAQFQGGNAQLGQLGMNLSGKEDSYRTILLKLFSNRLQ